MSNESDDASPFRLSNAASVACRMLIANPIPALSKSLRVIRTITGNILKNPDQQKFRRLKLTNSKVRTTILEVPGAFKLLTSIGFQKHTSAEGDGYLEIPQTDALKNLRIANDWVTRKITVAAEKGKGQMLDILLQVKLPGGKSVQLGFNETDRLFLLRAIVAKHLYCKQHFELRTLAPPVTFSTPEALEQTFREAGFTRRCCILVHDTTASHRGMLSKAAAHRSVATPHAKNVSRRQRQQYFEKLRKQRQKKEKDRVDERRAALIAFREDREDHKTRKLFRSPASSAAKADEAPATADTSNEAPATDEAANEAPATVDAANEAPATADAANEIPDI